MSAADIDRMTKEAEGRAASIDEVLAKATVDRASAEALRIIAAQLVLIRAELAGLRLAILEARPRAASLRRLPLKNPKDTSPERTSVTYYVALSFVRREDGSLAGQRPVECPNADAAIGCARNMMRDQAGAVAFSRTGDPDRGEFDPAIVLAAFGDVPEELPISREAY